MLIYITIVVLFIFGIFIFCDRPFYLSADQQLQYNIFYKEWIRLIKDFLHGGDLPMYSWTSFLGSDFYSSQAYYVVGDIFLPIILLFEHFDHACGINAALFVETILCVYISAISMRLLLKEHGIKDGLVLDMISVIYAISGWATPYYGQYMFHRFYAFLPLLFYGLERIINKKRNLVFIIAVFVLYLQNYYLMFPTTIFLFIYGIFTTFNRRMDIKSILKVGVYSIFCYFLGFLLSAFLSLPALTYMLSNPRVGTYGLKGIFWEPQTYLGFYMNFISSPFPIYTGYNNIFLSGSNGHQSWYSLFIGIAPLITCLQMCFNKKYKSYKYTFLLLLLILCLTPLSSIMHGFSEPSLRWTFIIILFTLLMSAKGLDDNLLSEKTSYSFLNAYFIGFIMLLLIGYLTGLINSNFREHLINLIVSIVFAAVIFFLFFKNKKYAMLLLILEMCLTNLQLIYIYNKNFYDYNESINSEYVDYFASQDSNLLYRYYIDNSKLMPSSSMNLNKSMQFHYMGLSTYNTLYDTNILDFLKYNGISWHIIDLKDFDIMPMLGVKYFAVTDESELPNTSDFTYVYNLNHYMVYETNQFKGFGYSANNVRYFKDINSSSEFTDTIFIDDENIDIAKYSSVIGSEFNITEKGNGHLKGNINSESNNILQIPVPNNKGWKILRNNEEVECVSVNGGFLGIEIDKGLNEIELYFVSPNFKLGFVLSAMSFLVIMLINSKYFKNKINDLIY